tara:strand:- start:57 stop:197 length:141 start_codon:yes stop_codon:yes gene_type:complete
MNKFKYFLINILNKKKQWLPSVIVIIVIFILLIFVGKVNPIVFIYG